MICQYKHGSLKVSMKEAGKLTRGHIDATITQLIGTEQWYLKEILSACKSVRRRFNGGKHLRSQFRVQKKKKTFMGKLSLLQEFN